MFVVMVTACLAGCGQQTASPTDEESPNENVEPENVQPEKEIKVALLCSGPINDGGWNTDAYNGLMNVGKKYGWETAYTENVIAADIPNVLRNYASNGFSLVFGNGYEYAEYMMEIGEEFPETCFFSICGVDGNGKNVGSGTFIWYELGYLTGTLAARITESGKVGFVGAMETPGIAAEVRVFKDTVTSLLPEANVSVSYTGSWTDVAKGYEAANAMINSGVDVIMGIGDACDAGAIQACEESNGRCKFIGFASDFNHLSPEIVICSAVQSTPFMIEAVADQFAKGEFVPEAVDYGIMNGASYMGVWAEDVDPAIKEEILGLEEAIRNGTLVLDISKWES
ncbi:MAG: BMP family protein [Zhaonellaceae bacterium]